MWFVEFQSQKSQSRGKKTRTEAQRQLNKWHVIRANQQFKAVVFIAWPHSYISLIRYLREKALLIL